VVELAALVGVVPVEGGAQPALRLLLVRLRDRVRVRDRLRVRVRVR